MKKNLFIVFVVILFFLLIYLIFDVDSNGLVKTISFIEEDNELGIVPNKLLDVPTICQYPQLPTGCESVAATMVLQYYEDNITAETFAGDWLECSGNFHSSNNELYGPDPNEVFVGNPFSEESYGCFASPIVNAVNSNSTKCTAKKIINKSLDEICTEYIDNDNPILIWATMGMKESKRGRSWYIQNGSKFTWIAGEHCLVLVGYSEDYYYLNDPQSGSMVVYEKSIVEKRYNELGTQAIFIYKNNK